MHTRIFRSKWVLALGALIVTAGLAQAMFFSKPPKDLDLSRTKTTEQGRYVGTVEPGLSHLAVRTLHTWTVALRTPAGAPVEGAQVKIDGNMPQHGHGLPTKPKVTKSLGDGRYLVEGMKFNMRGWWTLTVEVNGAAGADKVTFNIVL
jgi:hypothetical protein